MDAARILLIIAGDAAGGVAALEETSVAMKEVSAAAGESNESGLLGSLGKAGAAVAVLGLVVAAVSTKMAADFQQGTTRLITNAGETRDSVDNIIAPALLRLAVTTGYATSQLIEGFRQVSSAGFKGAEGVQVLTVASEGARAENADLGTVLNVVTSILNAYNLKASDSTTVMNTLTAAMQSGKLTLQDLSGALGTVIPAAANAHVSIQEVTSALAVMANEGIAPANAATYLRFTILNLSEPSAKAQAALKSIGLQADSLKNTLNQNGLGAAIEQLETAVAKKFPESAQAMRDEMAKVKAGTESLDDAVGKLSSGSFKGSEAISAITGGIRGMQGVLALGGAHLQGFRANTAGITDEVQKAGHTIIGWNEIQGNMNFQISRGREALEFLAITLGTHALPLVTQAAKLFADWAPKLVDAGPAIQRFAEGTAQAVGPWAQLVLHMLQAMGPFAWFLGPIAGVIANFGSIRDLVKVISGDMQAGAPAWLTFEDALQQMGVSADKAGEIGSRFRQVWAAVSPVIKTLGDVIRTINADVRAGTPFWLTFEDVLQVMGVNGEKAGEIGARLRSALEEAGGALRSLGQLLMQALGPALSQLGKEMGPLFAQLRAAAASLAPILAVLGVVIGVVLAVALGIAVGLIKATVAGLGVILPAAVHLAVLAIEIVIGVIKLAADILVGFVRIAVAIFRAFVFGDWTGLWNTMKDVVGTILGDIGNLIGDLFDAIGTIVDAAVRATLAMIVGFATGIWGWFQWLYHVLVGGSIVPELVNAVVSWITRLDSMVLGIIEGLVGGAASWFEQMASRAISAAESLVNGVVSRLQGMVGQALDVGRNLAQGIANGITAGLGAIANAAKNAAQTALNAAKNLLGISSPSTVAADDVGEPTAQGVAMGIDRGRPAAVAAMGRLVGSLTGTGGGGVSPSITASIASSVSSVTSSAVSVATGGSSRQEQLLLAIVQELRGIRTKAPSLGSQAASLRHA